MTISPLHRTRVTTAITAVLAAGLGASIATIVSNQAVPVRSATYFECDEEDLKYTAFDCDDVAAAREANADLEAYTIDQGRSVPATVEDDRRERPRPRNAPIPK